MQFIDYYEILGLKKDAKEDEIKKAYRKLARKLHPDLNQNDKDAHKRFQQVNEANEVLSDPEKRKKYDQYGKDWQSADQFEKARQSSRATYRSGDRAAPGDFNGGDFSDFFESMFGGSRNSGKGSGQTRFKGQDYNSELHLTLTDAYTTHQKTLNINGRNVRITIPAGIEHGQVIKLKGYGGEGMNGGLNGDLFITFYIANTPLYKRVGNDLYITQELNLYTAVLGGEIMIDTLSGKLKLKVKPEIQNGTITRLKGKGFPVYKEEGKFGDLYITYGIKIPTNLTDEQKELFRKLKETASSS